MKIWVTGATGLLGSAVCQKALARKHYVVGIGFSNLPEPKVISGLQYRKIDLRDQAAVTRWILEDFPDAIVNAAAVTENGSCMKDRTAATALNVGLPGLLASLSNHLSARLVQISTEQVFDGQIELPQRYTPDSTPNPSSLYGQLKWMGEQAIFEKGADFAAVLRLPLLQGNSPSGKRSFHERLFQLWSNGEPARLFTDQFRQPCTADSAAEAALELCEKPDLKGTFHWAGRERKSRYELGLAIADHFKLPREWVVAASYTDEERFRDQPPNLAIDVGQLQKSLRTQQETVEEQLDKLIVPKPFRSWYHELPPL